MTTFCVFEQILFHHTAMTKTLLCNLMKFVKDPIRHFASVEAQHTHFSSPYTL
jgi:hypothetical protein